MAEEVKWTDEQKQAIYEKDSNILVAAAAGSGKTAVLVERIINKIINEKIDIDRLLVVTFTNAAASEMRERVLKAIYKKKLNSKLGLKGILKKLGYIVIVVVATLFDYLIGDNTMAVRSLVIYFFISNEAISILENWAMMGLPLPNKIFQVFENLKDNDKKS